jgi:hypothetical protein
VRSDLSADLICLPAGFVGGGSSPSPPLVLGLFLGLSVLLDGVLAKFGAMIERLLCSQSDVEMGLLKEKVLSFDERLSSLMAWHPHDGSEYVDLANCRDVGTGGKYALRTR